jgi:hypothetical protein
MTKNDLVSSFIIVVSTWLSGMYSSRWVMLILIYLLLSYTEFFSREIEVQKFMYTNLV